MDTLTNVTRAADSTSDLPGARLVTDRVLRPIPSLDGSNTSGTSVCAATTNALARGLRPVLTDGRPR